MYVPKYLLRKKFIEDFFKNITLIILALCTVHFEVKFEKVYLLKMDPNFVFSLTFIKTPQSTADIATIWTKS